jgi:hypothetical protein
MSPFIQRNRVTGFLPVARIVSPYPPHQKWSGVGGPNSEVGTDTLVLYVLNTIIPRR